MAEEKKKTGLTLCGSAGGCYRAPHFEEPQKSQEAPPLSHRWANFGAERSVDLPKVRTWGPRFPQEHLSPRIPKTFSGIVNARGKLSGNPTRAPYFKKSHHLLSSANVQRLKNCFNESRRNRRLRPCSTSQVRGTQDKYLQIRGR